MDEINRNNLQSFCRTCLERLQSTDTPRIHISQCSKLAKLLVLCTSLDVTDDNEDQHSVHPQCLCRKCHDRLQDFQEFREMTQQSAAALQEILKEDTKSSIQRIATVPLNNEESYGTALDNKFEIIEVVSAEPTFTDSYSAAADECTNVYSELQTEADVTNEVIFELIEEGSIKAKNSSSIGKRADVLASTDEDKSNAMEFIQIVGNNKELECKVNKASLRDACESIQNNVGESAKDKNEAASFYSTAKPAKRRQNADNDIEKYKNLKSRKRIHNSEIINPYVHELKTEIGSDLFCYECSKQFRAKHHYKQHVERKHMHLQKQTCQICGVIKLSIIELKTHMQIHDPKAEKFKCPQCPQLLAHKTAIRRHVRIMHEGLRPYVCSLCPKTFTTKTIKELHELQHDTKAFACKICYNRFRLETGLKHHMYVIHKRKTSSCI